MSGDWQLRIVPAIAAGFIRLLHTSLRIRHFGSDNIDRLNAEGRGYIFTVWHAQLLLMVYARFTRPFMVMVSQHRDGELIARTLQKFGVDLARGSTTRGGTTALREMVRAAKSGSILSFTPDGPRGPRRRAQAGVITAARLTGLPILPAALVAKKKSLSPHGTDSRSLIRSRELFMYTESRFLFRAA